MKKRASITIRKGKSYSSGMVELKIDTGKTTQYAWVTIKDFKAAWNGKDQIPCFWKEERK